MADTVLVTVPGIMGNMSLATAQSLGLNYTVVPPTPAPALTPVSVSLPPPPPPVAAPVSYAPPLDPFSYIAPLDIPVSVPAQSLVVSPAPSLGSTLGTGAQVGTGAPSYVPAPESLSPTPVDYSPPLNPFEYIAPVDIPVSLPALGVEEKKLEEEEVAKKTILGTATDAVAELNTSPIAKLVVSGGVGPAAGAGSLAGVNPNPAADIQNTPIGQLAGSGGIFTGSLGIGLAPPSEPVVSTPVVDKGLFGNIAATIQGMASEAQAKSEVVTTPKVTTPLITLPTPISSILGSSFVQKPETKQFESVVQPGLVQSALNQWANKAPTVELSPPVLISPNLSPAITPSIWAKVEENKPWVNAPPSDLSFGTWLKSDTTGSNIMKAAMAVGVIPVAAGAVLTAPIWAPVVAPAVATIGQTGIALVGGSGILATVVGSTQKQKPIDTVPYEAPVAKAVAIQDKWKGVQVTTDAGGTSVVEVAPAQAKAYQDAVAEVERLSGGLDKWKQYEFLSDDGTVKLNVTEEQFEAYKSDLAAADAAVNKAKGLFEVYKVNSDRLFGQYSADMASLSGQIPDIYKKVDGTINVNQMIKDMGEASALSTLAAAGQKPTIAGEIYDKLSPEAQALYTKGQVSPAAQGGIFGAWGKGVETLYKPVTTFFEDKGVAGSLAGGMFSYLVPQQLAYQMYEQKGPVGLTALVPHFGATVVPVALNWNETSNLNKAMGIGFAVSPYLVGPVGGVLGKVGQVVSKVPVVGPISKVVGSVVTAPIKLVQDVGEGTGLSKLGQYMPWQAAYVPTKLAASAGLAQTSFGATGAKWGWWSKDIVPINKFVSKEQLATPEVVTPFEKIVLDLEKEMAPKQYVSPKQPSWATGETKYRSSGAAPVAKWVNGKLEWEVSGKGSSYTAPKAPPQSIAEAIKNQSAADARYGVGGYGPKLGPESKPSFMDKLLGRDITGDFSLPGGKPGAFGGQAPKVRYGDYGIEIKTELPQSFIQRLGSNLSVVAKSPVVKVGLAGSVLGISLIPGMAQISHVGQVGGVDVSQASVKDLQAAQNILKQQDSLLSKQSSLVSQLNSGQISAEKYNQEVVSVNEGITSLQQQVDNLPQSVQGVVTPTQSVLQSQAQSLSGQVAPVQEEVGGVVVGQPGVGVQSQSLNLPIQQIGQVNISQVSTQISSPTQQALQQTQQTQSQLQEVQVQLQNQLQQLQQELQNLINQEQTQVSQEQMQQIQQQIQQLQQIQVQVNIQQDILSQYVSEGGIVPPIVPPIFPPMVGSPRGGEGWGGGFGGLLKGGIGTWVTRGYSMVGINPLTGKITKYQALKKGIKYGNVQKKRLGQPAYKAVRV